MSGKKDNKKEKLKSLKKADERLKKEKKGVKKTKRKRGSGKKIAVGTAAAAVCILAAGYVAGAVYYQNRFYPGTEINGVKCGGQTVAEVKKDVKETSETYTLTIQEKDDKKEIISGDTIKLTYKDVWKRPRRSKIPGFGLCRFLETKLIKSVWTVLMMRPA